MTDCTEQHPATPHNDLARQGQAHNDLAREGQDGRTGEAPS